VSHRLDLGVTIERVRVRAGATAEPRPRPAFVTGYLGAAAGAALHDHRVVIRELHIDVEAELDAAGARHLAREVAGELARRLAELQARRAPHIARTPSAGGPVHVETLRVHLRGDPARHPPSHQISLALMTAFEGRLRDA